jgi:ribosomal protein S18 acetylase RimI-like enzyme
MALAVDPGARRAPERACTGVTIRAASIADVERCQRLDGSYTTGHIWHLDESVRSDEIQVSLRRVHIPRTMEMQDPRLQDDLFQVWQQSRCFMVAEELGVVLGYVSMGVQLETWRGTIDRLAVHRPYRRKGIASLLLEGAERWSRGSELTGVTAIVQSKNDPAMHLFPRRGFSFRGYIDGYFASGDLGIVYTLPL